MQNANRKSPNVAAINHEEPDHYVPRKRVEWVETPVSSLGGCNNARAMQGYRSLEETTNANAM